MERQFRKRRTLLICYDERGGKKINWGENIKYYQCNRSGFYKPKRKGKRKIKSSRSESIVFIIFLSVAAIYKIFMIFVFFLFLFT